MGASSLDVFLKIDIAAISISNLLIYSQELIFFC